MQPIGIVLCKNTIHDLFRVLDLEGLGFIRNEDNLGLLYRVFPQRTLEWALAGEYRERVVEILKRFSSFFNTVIGLFYTGSPNKCAVINFVLLGRLGAYVLPMAELASDSDTLFVPMDVTDFLSGEVVKKGTRINVQYEYIPTERGEIKACILWFDDNLLHNLEF